MMANIIMARIRPPPYNDSTVLKKSSTLEHFPKRFFQEFGLPIWSSPFLVPQLVNARQRLDSHTAVLSQAVVARFISEGYFASHLRLMKKLYAARRHLLLELLEECPAGTVRVLPSEGGLQLAIEYLKGDTSAITASASRKGVMLTELAPLCLTSPP